MGYDYKIGDIIIYNKGAIGKVVEELDWDGEIRIYIISSINGGYSHAVDDTFYVFTSNVSLVSLIRKHSVC